jgi:hypothetical protein
MIGSACIAEDGDGVFAAKDRAFGDHQRIVLRRFGVGNAKIARRLTLLMPIDEPSQAGLTNSGSPSSASTRRKSLSRRAARIPAPAGPRPPEQLAAPFVHAQRRGHHAAAGVGNAHQFENTLDGAVFAVAPVQRDESAIEGASSSSLRSDRIEGSASTPCRCKAARTREPLFSDTSRSAERPPKSTATFAEILDVHRPSS